MFGLRGVARIAAIIAITIGVLAGGRVGPPPPGKRGGQPHTPGTKSDNPPSPPPYPWPPGLM